MEKSVITELELHVIDLINDGAINADNLDDAHHIAFNEDYYIIGYYNADQWLKKHDISAWEAIDYVIEQEQYHFGESYIKPGDVNSERIVNLYVYFAGYEIDINNLYEQEKGEAA